MVEALNSSIASPRFFSLAFHKDFFPTVLRKSLSKDRKLTAASHFSPILEISVAFFFCLFLIVLGLPLFLKRHLLIGGFLSLIGFLGVITLIIVGIYSERNSRYNFDDFVPAVFFFFILSGFTAGFLAGFIYQLGYFTLVTCLVGLLLGYAIGIFAGVGINYLGFARVFINYAIILLIIFMAILDVGLLFGFMSGKPF